MHSPTAPTGSILRPWRFVEATALARVEIPEQVRDHAWQVTRDAGEVTGFNRPYLRMWRMWNLDDAVMGPQPFLEKSGAIRSAAETSRPAIIDRPMEVTADPGRKMVEMRGDGPGRRFIVRLPTAEAASALPAEGAGPGLDTDPIQPGADDFKSRRLLVADDNRDAALTLSSLLTMMGHEVRTAHDGVEAIDAATAFRPDIIFLDIGMPRMDGYEACRRIRSLGHVPAPVIVALTGWGRADDKRKAQDAGFDHHFTKPVDPARLEALVGSHF